MSRFWRLPGLPPLKDCFGEDFSKLVKRKLGRTICRRNVLDFRKWLAGEWEEPFGSPLGLFGSFLEALWSLLEPTWNSVEASWITSGSPREVHNSVA